MVRAKSFVYRVAIDLVAKPFYLYYLGEVHIIGRATSSHVKAIVAKPLHHLYPPWSFHVFYWCHLLQCFEWLTYSYLRWLGPNLVDKVQSLGWCFYHRGDATNSSQMLLYMISGQTWGLQDPYGLHHTWGHGWPWWSNNHTSVPHFWKCDWWHCCSSIALAIFVGGLGHGDVPTLAWKCNFPLYSL